MSREALGLFSRHKVDAGHVPEFDLPPTGRLAEVLVLPGRGLEPEVLRAEGTVIVPHYEVRHVAAEGQAAVDAVVDEAADDAWRLLLAAATLNRRFVGESRRDVEEAIALHLRGNRSAQEVRPHFVCRGQEVIGYFGEGWESLVMTVHDGPTLMHAPHGKPTAWIDMGLAILDARHVVGGRFFEREKKG